VAKTSEELLGEFEQGELFLKFTDHPDFLCKKMFGGLSCYLDGLMVACLVEGDFDDRHWKGVDHGFPIWRGLLLPTDYDHHKSLLKALPGTMNHPVLKKWLYLPLDADDYDDSARTWIKLIRKKDPRFGVVPTPRKKKKLS